MNRDTLLEMIETQKGLIETAQFMCDVLYTPGQRRNPRYEYWLDKVRIRKLDLSLMQAKLSTL